MTAAETLALTSAALEAFRSKTPADLHRMLTEQNADVRSQVAALAH